eukprot:CAMPEP_0113598044 /NCGR_PEP_ID=MMETSP0015_2-20120614/41350_1 /TAXON_ID=2838 /ORGANISM="Odontella" /LENGTH=792 /DNA_ID=CAMNT_0000505981 /DNA_START=229 /DNA_END=2603 /DNA_ORIENTATION=+ /assembly_acc=CAM_ASM_000160
MKFLGELKKKKTFRSHDTQVTVPIQEGESSHEDSMGSFAPSTREQPWDEDDESSAPPTQQPLDDDDQSSVPPPPPSLPPPADDNSTDITLNETASSSVVQFADGDAIEMQFTPVDLRIMERIEQAREDESFQGDYDPRKVLMPQPRRKRAVTVCVAVVILFAAIAAAALLGATRIGSGGRQTVIASNDIIPPLSLYPSTLSPTPSPSETPSQHEEGKVNITTAPTVSTMDTAPTVSTMTRAPTVSTMTTAPTVSTMTTAPTVSTMTTAPTVSTMTTVPTVSTISPTQTDAPVVSPVNTLEPTSFRLTSIPTYHPTFEPTFLPSYQPTLALNPSHFPTVVTTFVPTAAPTKGLLPSLAPSTSPPTSSSPTRQPTTPKMEWWGHVQEILNRIQPPSVPDTDFDVTDFLGDERHRTLRNVVTPYTDAFRNAIETCYAAGGGRVVVPPGTYRTGPIRLRSNVTLHLSEGAVIEFSANPDDYLPPVFTRFEGMELMNYSPLIYALKEKNIAITGTGIIDGRADDGPWWRWTGRQDSALRRLERMASNGRRVEDRVFGDGYFIYPQFIQFYECENVLIEDVSIKNSPMWAVHPVLSQNVIVRGISIETEGPGDGISVESCSDVLIERCVVNVGSEGDGISFKSGRNEDGRRVNKPSSGIIVRKVRIDEADNAVSIGSETSGDVRNIFLEEITIEDANNGFRVKTNSVRGGTIENVYMNDITVKRAMEAAMKIGMYYAEGDSGDHDPVVRNFEVHDFRCDDAVFGIVIRGYDRAPIEDVRFVNFHVEAERHDVIENVRG